MHYLLIYDLVDDYIERRAPLRAEHLALARAAEARGELILGGALANPPDGAVLLFRGDSPAAAEAFARADPVCEERSRHALACSRMDDGRRTGRGGEAPVTSTRMR